MFLVLSANKSPTVPATLEIVVPHTCCAAADGENRVPSTGAGPKS